MKLFIEYIFIIILLFIIEINHGEIIDTSTTLTTSLLQSQSQPQKQHSIFLPTQLQSQFHNNQTSIRIQSGSTSSPSFAPTTSSELTDTSRKGSDDDFIEYRNTKHATVYLINFLFAGFNFILLIFTTCSLFSIDFCNKPNNNNNQHNNNNNQNNNLYSLQQKRILKKIHNSVAPMNEQLELITEIVERQPQYLLEEGRRGNEDEEESDTNLNPLELSGEFLDFAFITEALSPENETEENNLNNNNISNILSPPPPHPSAIGVNNNINNAEAYRQPMFDFLGLLRDRRERQPLNSNTLQQLQQTYNQRPIFSIFPTNLPPYVLPNRPDASNQFNTANAPPVVMLNPRQVNVLASPTNRTPFTPVIPFGITSANQISFPRMMNRRNRRRIIQQDQRENEEYVGYRNQWSIYMNSIAFVLLGIHFGFASFGINTLGIQYYAANLMITNVISILSLVFCVFNVLYRRILFVFYFCSLAVVIISFSLIVYFKN